MIDKKFWIARGRSNRGRVENHEFDWVTFCSRFVDPKRTSETRAEFVALERDKQNDLKNANGYIIGGFCRDGRRARAFVEFHSIVTLDIDDCDPETAEKILTGEFHRLAWSYLVHTTRNHTADKPRIRVIIPLNRDVRSDEYEPLVRLVAHRLDPSMELVSEESFRYAQIMYLPTVSKDQTNYICSWYENGLLDPNKALRKWDCKYTSLPLKKKEHEYRPTAERAEDPLTKGGIVGGFCRTFSIHEAITEFLSDVYEPYEDDPNRYTYIPGDGAGGVVIYEDKWIYSHHGTDPCGGRLWNAFDMVRLHKFGELDRDENPRKKVMNLPSYRETVKLVGENQQVVENIQQIDDSEWELGEPTGNFIDRLNERFAVVVDGRQSRQTKILIQDEKYLDEGQHYALMPVQEAKVLLSNELVAVPDKKEPVPIFEMWIKSGRRREYPKGRVFAPGKTVGDGMFNTWNGWKYQPVKGDTDLFESHVTHVICNNDYLAAEYVLDWIAHLFQYPQTKPGVALVLTGKEGAGKDIFSGLVGDLASPYDTSITNAEQWLGRFGAANLADKLLLRAEEAVYANNMAHQKQLLHLVTAQHLYSEQKFQMGEDRPSYLRIIMTSNDPHVVSASAEARRYAVFNVSDKMRNDHEYFRRLRNTDMHALMHFFLERDISDFNVHNRPENLALEKQRIHSFRNIDAWIYDFLSEGEIREDFELKKDWSKLRYAGIKELHELYVEWMKDQKHEGKVLGKSPFLDRLSEIFTIERKTVRGTRFKIFPSLSQMRTEFAKAKGIEDRWD